ncbi:MAG TPA: peptidoglycan editing factor PgeF [Geminicoccaceae bacterium]|nr:peptidoglycan editing factor PgeF [Geminicoccus sp.]HMU52505.1 peptidoglycan editing factor PgeF [Geminicoccaceae bacterium]
MTFASTLSGVPHRFFGRQGGVSEGVWNSLNVGIRSGDEIERVMENRGRCARTLDFEPERLAVARQVHGTAVAEVDTVWPADRAPDADAVITRMPGVLLGVVTADCAPVLLADAEAGIVGAVHAGWRGALDGVIEATVEAMRRIGAGRISAAIGPCIAQASYEVGPDYRHRFVSVEPAAAGLFAPVVGSDRLLFDLKGFCRLRLARAGVDDADILADDTCADDQRFFSFRRATKRQEDRFGLQLSAIGLP